MEVFAGNPASERFYEGTVLALFITQLLSCIVLSPLALVLFVKSSWRTAGAGTKIFWMALAGLPSLAGLLVVIARVLNVGIQC